MRGISQLICLESLCGRKGRYQGVLAWARIDPAASRRPLQPLVPHHDRHLHPHPPHPPQVYEGMSGSMDVSRAIYARG